MAKMAVATAPSRPAVSWRLLNATSSGISPDIEVEASPNDFKSSDPVLAAALEHLRDPRNR
jgi:hypothetical protein